MQAGGGLMVGVEQFQMDQQCGAGAAQVPSRVTVTNSTFLGNVASSRGGGVHVEAGQLVMDVSSLRCLPQRKQLYQLSGQHPARLAASARMRKVGSNPSIICYVEKTIIMFCPGC